MKIVGICGSPRSESISTYLLETIIDKAIANGNEAKVYHLKTLT